MTRGGSGEHGREKRKDSPAALRRTALPREALLSLWSTLLGATSWLRATGRRPSLVPPLRSFAVLERSPRPQLDTLAHVKKTAATLDSVAAACALQGDLAAPEAAQSGEEAHAAEEGGKGCRFGHDDQIDLVEH